MKTFRYLLSAALVAMATSASAQFANGGSNGGGFSGGSASNEDYSLFKINYASSMLSFDGSDADDALKGASLEYLYGKSISSNLPLFVEYGVNFSYVSFSEEEDDYYHDSEYKVSLMWIQIPVNVAYKFAVNEGVSIEPYAGVGFRYHISGKEKVSYGKESEEADFFDKDDMGKGQWNRFILCGQIGARACFNNYFVSYEYSTNFMELAKKTDINTNFISVGIKF